jgi:hypothetical protein
MHLSFLIRLLILFCALSQAQAQERTELHLFKYAGTDAENLKTAFLNFKDLMREQMPLLSSELVEELENRGGIDIPAVGRLMLKPIVDEQGNLRVSAGSLDDRRRYWRETGALGVLTGKLQLKQDIPTIRTFFRWGELHAPDANETITLELPVNGEAFDTTNDSHSVATLYALAHEIGRDCVQRASAFYLLSEADKRARAVAEDNVGMGTELQLMVSQAIAALRERCHD